MDRETLIQNTVKELDGWFNIEAPFNDGPSMDMLLEDMLDEYDKDKYSKEDMIKALRKGFALGAVSTTKDYTSVDLDKDTNEFLQSIKPEVPLVIEEIKYTEAQVRRAIDQAVRVAEYFDHKEYEYEQIIKNINK